MTNGKVYIIDKPAILDKLNDLCLSIGEIAADEPDEERQGKLWQIQDQAADLVFEILDMN